MPRKLTNSEFIEKCLLTHHDKYDYSNTFYNGSKNKVTIICKSHGEFSQIASDHLNGCGCPFCDTTIRMSNELFIERSKLIHTDKYDYSLVIYGNNNYDFVKIICKEHGVFEQRPWAHLRGQGCPGCNSSIMMNRDEFIEQCKKIHGDKYDYSDLDYNGRRKYINIICKKHGSFKQEARIHLSGHGCKKCKSSKLETYLSSRLDTIGEIYEIDKRFGDCKNKYKLPFDFYLTKRNILIECDGIQHHKPIGFFGGYDRFEYQKENDRIKNEWCNKNNIILIRLNNKKEIDVFIHNLIHSLI